LNNIVNAKDHDYTSTFYGCPDECDTEEDPKCDIKVPNNKLFIAMHPMYFEGDSKEDYIYCGKYAIAMPLDYEKAVGNYKLVKGKVIDQCGTCVKSQIDLSQPAFEKLAKKSTGVLKIVWKIISSEGKIFVNDKYDSEYLEKLSKKTGVSQKTILDSYDEVALYMATHDIDYISEWPWEYLKKIGSNNNKKTTNKATTIKRTTTTTTRKPITTTIKKTTTTRKPITTTTTKKPTTTHKPTTIISTTKKPQTTQISNNKRPATPVSHTTKTPNRTPITNTKRPTTTRRPITTIIERPAAVSNNESHSNNGRVEKAATTKKINTTTEAIKAKPTTTTTTTDEAANEKINTENQKVDNNANANKKENTQPTPLANTQKVADKTQNVQSAVKENNENGGGNYIPVVFGGFFAAGVGIIAFVKRAPIQTYSTILAQDFL